MNKNTLRPCEGYCGGRVKLKNVRTVKGGGRFCPECYEKAQNRTEE